MNAKVISSAYEMFSDKIEDTIVLEPFYDGDPDNPIVRIVDRNIEFLEDTLSLSWTEIKNRLKE